MAFWLSPEVSTRDPIISPRALALFIHGVSLIEALFINVAYNITENISSRAILRQNNILTNTCLPLSS